MFDHIALPVADYARSKAFYQAVLAPLKFVLVVESGPASAGFGVPGRPKFWISGGEGSLKGELHVAFEASDHGAVQAFHRAALEAGGTDNGVPGLRPDYHANYFAAFVRDPDGHNIEAVCHFPGRFQDQFSKSENNP